MPHNVDKDMLGDFVVGMLLVLVVLPLVGILAFGAIRDAQIRQSPDWDCPHDVCYRANPKQKSPAG